MLQKYYNKNVSYRANMIQGYSVKIYNVIRREIIYDSTVLWLSQTSAIHDIIRDMRNVIFNELFSEIIVLDSIMSVF